MWTLSEIVKRKVKNIMSKKTSYTRICERNFIQSHLSKKLLRKQKVPNYALQQQLDREQSKQNTKHNLHQIALKLQQTGNTKNKFVTPSNTYGGGHNFAANNRITQTATTSKNLPATLHFRPNSLWCRDSEQARQMQLTAKCKCNKGCRNNPKKWSMKLVNLSNPQQLRKHFTLQSCCRHQEKHIGKNNTHKSLNIGYEYYYSPPVVVGNKRQLHTAKAHPPKLANNYSQCKEYQSRQNNCRYSCLELQYQEILLRLFEVLSPHLLLEASACESFTHWTAGAVSSCAASQYRNHYALESNKSWECQTDAKVKIINSSVRRGHIDDVGGLDYQRVLKFIKTKPSDPDVIFGNASLLTHKHYGWESSRIEWLLKLEQQHLNRTKNKVTHNKY